MGGGVIADLMHREPLLGRNIQTRLDEINRLKDEYYSNHRVSCRIGKLKQQHIQFGGSLKWAELHAPHIKAANTRHLSPWVLQLSNEFFQGPAVWHGSLRKVSAAIDGSYRLMEANDFFMSAVDEAIPISVVLCTHPTSFMQKPPASKATSQCVPVLLLSPILFTLRFA